MNSRFAVAPFVVFFGGFGSCFIDGHPSEIRSADVIHQFIQDVSSAHGNEPVPAIQACYAIGNSPIYSAQYDHTDQTYYDAGSSDLTSLFDWIEEKSAGRPLVIVGQSHGGWTAMKAALHLTRSVDVLATVDPISVEECHPAAFSASTIGYASLGFKPWPGCTRAPQDLKDHFTEIRIKTGTWHNFYQTETKFLRSSKIPEATTNGRLTYSGSTWNPMRGHAYTESDQRVWSKVLTSVKSAISKSDR